MTSLLTNWTLDRMPGTGKAIDSTGSGGAPNAHVGGLVGLGASGALPTTSYAPLPPAGTPIPPPGDAAARAPFFLAYKAAVAFDGFTMLYGWTKPASDTTQFSLSVFLNFAGQPTVWTADPGHGCLFSTLLSSAGDHQLFCATPGETDAGTGDPLAYPNPMGSEAATSDLSPQNGLFPYPGQSSPSAGWVHLMMSARLIAQSGNTHAQAIIVVKDTVITNNIISAGNLGLASLSKAFDWTSADDVPNFILANVGGTNNNDYAGNGANHQKPTGLGLKGAVTEYWFNDHAYVDWTDPVVRAKFHTSDAGWGVTNATYAPVDIGARGTRPGYGTPRLYLTGRPGLFTTNRATGQVLSTYAGAGGLILVDDPPT